VHTRVPSAHLAVQARRGLTEVVRTVWYPRNVGNDRRPNSTRQSKSIAHDAIGRVRRQPLLSLSADYITMRPAQ